MLVGAALGAQMSNVWVAFLLGLISHYIIDAFPHWEYITRANASDPNHVKRVFVDFAIGAILVLVFVWSEPNIIVILAAVIGSILPDFLHGMCYNFKIKWLRPHLLIHHKIHARTKLSFKQGMLSTIIVSLAAILVLIL